MGLLRRTRRAHERAARRARIEPLEPRILLSADVPGAESLVLPPDPEAQTLHLTAPDSDPLAQTLEQHARRRELVFIDPGVADADKLVADLREGAGEDREIEVFWLDAERDGVAQIGEILAGRSQPVDAVHVVSHGTNAGIQLGSTWLTADNVGGHAGTLSGWSDALAADADLLLYGCNLAAGEDGQALIETLGLLTGTDVAASVDATGAALLGGDWVLEYATGSIESSVAFGASAQASWAGVLDGTAIWAESGSDIPNTAEFNGTDFDPAVPGVDVGHRWEVIAGAESPTRDEKIVIGVGDDKKLSVMVWNGSSWTNSEPTNLDLLTLAGSDKWSVDVAYESQSGDAVVVWSSGDIPGLEIGSAVWDGTGFGPLNIFSSPVPGEVVQLKLAADPTSDEMMLVASNDSGQTFAHIWDGDSWDAGTHFADGDVNAAVTDVNVVYEQQSGDAMVVYGTDSGVWGTDAMAQIWNGATWTASTIVAPGTVGGGITFSAVAADPNSDRIAFGAVTANRYIWLSVWDGDSWEASKTATSNTPHSDRQAVAVAFESTSGEAIAAYATGNDRVRYRTWDSTDGWSSRGSGPNLGSHPDSLTLDSDPASDQVMLSVVDQERDVTFALWDGDGWTVEETPTLDAGTNQGQPFLYLWDHGATVQTDGLWISTDDVVSGGQSKGIDTWDKDAIVQIGNPDLAVEPGTTDGTFSAILDLVNDFGAEVGTELTGLHLVTRDVVVGGSVSLQAGDVLFTVNGAQPTLTSTNSIGMDKDDVVRFRPDTPGNYSVGTFELVLDDPLLGGSDLGGISLVERDMTVGGQALSAGDFLLVETKGVDNLVHHFAVTGAGASTSGTLTTLIDGTDLGIGAANFASVHLVTDSTLIGKTELDAGTVIVSVDKTLSGFAGVPTVTPRDLVALDVSTAGLSTVASGTLLFEGADVRLDSGAESIEALSLKVSALASGASGPTTADAGGPYTIKEGESVDLDGSGSIDPQGDPLTYDWDLDGDLVYGDVTGETPTVDWATLQSFGIDDDGAYVIRLRVTDDQGATVETATNLTVDNVAPTITVTGPSSVEEDAIYTLALSASDPGNETIASWTINWGDGTIETVGDVPSATHVYSVAGFTRNITVSVTDEDGTFVAGDLLLSSNVTDSAFRFDAATGSFVEEFADADGLNNPVGIEIGPDGLIYMTGFSSNDVRRYDMATGDFVDVFVPAGSGLDGPARLAFGPDGDLFVSSLFSDEVLRFDGTTGTSLGAFVTTGSGGLDAPDGITFGPDGNLYVYSGLGEVLRYDGRTGAFIDRFADIGGSGYGDLVFGPDGNLYASNVAMNRVERFDGGDGTKIDDFVSSGSGGIAGTSGLLFGPDGHLYVVGFSSDNVLRYDATDGSFVDEFISSETGQNQPVNLRLTPAQQVLVTDKAETPTVTPTTTDEDVLSSSGLVVDRNAADGSEVTHFKITNIANGTLFKNDGTTVIVDGDFITLSEANAGLKFLGDTDYYGPASFDVQASTTGDDTSLSTAATASITVNPVNDAPVLTPGGPALTGIDEDDVGNGGDLISSILGISVSDADASPLEGIAITDLSSGNGTWQYRIGAGSWTDVGSVSDASALLLTDSDWIRFVPDEENADTADFTYRAWDQTSGAAGDRADASMNGDKTAFSTDDDTASITVSPVNDAPTIAGTVSGQAVDETDTIAAFATVVIGDVDLPDQTVTVDIQLDVAAKGVLLNLGGFTDLGGGQYQFTGTAADATTDIQAILFDPDESRIPPSETTTFTITVADGVAPPVMDADTSVITSFVNVAPTIGGALADQPVTDKTTVDPFSGVTVGDADAPAQTLTVDVQLDVAAHGVLTNLSGFTDEGGGLYQFVGTALDATAAIQALTFDPTENRVTPGAIEVTFFTITVDDGIGTAAMDSTTSVVSTSIEDAPTIGGTLADQPVTDKTTVDPFSGVSFDDADNPAQTLTVEIQLDDASKGALTNLGSFTDEGGGLYQFVGTALDATTAIQALTFDPTENRVAPGATETTTFTISADDGNTAPAMDATTTVDSTSIDDSPTIAGALADQPVTDKTTVDPFSGVSFDDADNPAQTLTVEIQLDDASKGALTNLGSFTDEGGGLYQFVGTALDATTAIQALTFDPTENRVAPGATETTTFTISADDGNTAPAMDATTTVDSTSIDDSPTIAGALADQSVTDKTTVDPFSGVSLGDADNPAQTLTVEIQLDDASKGVLTNLGSFTDEGGGLYRFSGNAGNATFAIQALTFDPGENRVAPGATETTTFTITADDGSTALAMDSTTTVVSTSVEDAPTIAGTLADQPVTDQTTVDPFSGVTIDDVDNPAQTVTVQIQLDVPAQGVLTNLGSFTDEGGGLYQFIGTALDATTAIQALTFDPTENRVAPGATETTGFTISVDDGGSTPAMDSVTTVVSTSVNDAPDLNPFGPSLTPISEDEVNGAGELVSDILGGSIGDSDTDAEFGIAITSLSSGNGTWEFSLNAGSSWSAISGVTNANALLLRESDLVRFVPDGANGTTASFDYRAWDETTGTAGTQLDTGSGGGTSAFSFDTDTASIVVGDVNDAPTLDPSASPVLNPVAEDAGAPGLGDGTLISTLVDLPGGGGNDNVTDVDTVASLGIAVTGADTANGSWHYSTDGGTSWNALSSVDPDSARLLAADGTTRLYFQPDPDFDGTATITFVAWDGTTGANGGLGDTTPPGGTTAFSATSDTAQVAVTADDDAPTLSGIVTGQTVTDETTVDPFSTVVFGDMDSASVTVTIVLDAAAKGQLVNLGGFVEAPAGTYSFTGTTGAATTAIQAITFDPTENRVDPGLTETTTFTITVSDGTTPVADANTTVISTSLNDAPTLAVTTPTLTAMTEDDGATLGTQVNSVLGTAMSDVDTVAPEGIAVTALSGGNGVWEFSTNGGGSWSSIGSVSAGNALLLEDADRIRFRPDGTNGTSASFDFRAWDQSSGSAGSKVNASTTGGSTAFSTNSDTARLDVASLNDAPRIGNATLDAADASGATVGSLFGGGVDDVDSGSSLAGVAVVSNAADALGEGAWQYSSDGGANWSDVGSVADGATALALDPATRLRFVAVKGFEGQPTALVVRALDDTHVGSFASTAGGSETRRFADTTPNGGTTAVSGDTGTLVTSVTAEIDLSGVDLTPEEEIKPTEEIEETIEETPIEPDPVPEVELPPTVPEARAPELVGLLELSDNGPQSVLAREARAEANPLAPSNLRLERKPEVEVQRLSFGALERVVSQELAFLGGGSDFLHELDRVREDLGSGDFVERTVVGSSVAVSAGLSIGYVIWLTRGGLLIASLASSMPAWRLIDPIPVLASLAVQGEDGRSQESLSSIVRESAEEAEETAAEETQA